MDKSSSQELPKLDGIIDTVVVSYHLQADASDKTNFDKTKFETAVKDCLRQEIIEEVYEYKKVEIIREAKSEIEEEKKKSSFAAIKSIMWEGFVLALIVGLLVNEITYMIEYLKDLGGANAQIIVTVILIIVFAVIVLSLYIIKFTKDIINKFVKNKKNK